MSTVEKTAEKTAKATKHAAKVAASQIHPVDISTTKNAINIKLGKQQIVLIAGTAAATVGTLKLVQIVKARRNTIRVNNENDLLS